jgi:hypothetical protein
MLTGAYIVYLLLSIAIAIWVGRTLSRNGRVFLVENFEVIEFLSTKIGLVIMLLGAMHFFNMLALIKFHHFKWAIPAKGKEEACAA